MTAHHYRGKADLFNQLHHNGPLLILPNIWDPLGALLLESLGYPAVATASAAIAFANGYPDGEKIPFDDLLLILQKIVRCVKIPVTVDIESGYAENNAMLKENIKKLIDVGIVGINLEDSTPGAKFIIPVEEQCKKISLIKETSIAMGCPLFINARTDVYLKENALSENEKRSTSIQRGKAYKEAGADGFYPILLKNKEDIETIIQEVTLPVNLLLLPGIPGFDTLRTMAVSRVSLGPGFLKISVNALKSLAEKLLQDEGMFVLAKNPVTTDYLKDLIDKI
ncbi:MAG TPA: isocitrate lyase/phosphoenolpyruvate mutase family protein [Mucilaginibacter sp.]|nr:isocitrate lyase/phosphoenolpyruvate mutase family protein [Mucilaginibacter sp.]